MKTLGVFDPQNKINLDDISLLTIVIESIKKLCDVERHIRMEFYSEPHFFCKNDEKSEEIEDVSCVINDIFTLDYNSKRNINALFKIIRKTYVNDLFFYLEDVKGKIKTLINTINMNFELNLTSSDEIKIEDLFKLVDLKIEDKEENRVQRLINYLKTINELTGKTLFFIFRMHDYFDNYEIDIILKEVAYKNIKIINIEHINSFKKCNDEQIIIYDNDLCLLI